MDAKTDIVAYVSENPVTAFTDEVAYSQFYERVKAEVSTHVPDISTEKGRKAITSLAYKVIRSKTAIDAAGKKLNESKRAEINKVDAQRRKIRDELDRLAADVRRPLTEWEDAEKERQATIAEAIEELIALIQSPAPSGASAEAIGDRITEVQAATYDPAVFNDQLGQVEELRARALDSLRSAFERQRQHEEDQAELARLRQEQEDRERREREDREKAEAAERERLRKEREVAEAKAREEAAIKRAQEKVEREAAERIKAAEAESRRIRDEAERKERERLEAENRQRREEEQRAADREHRSKIMSAAKEAIMAAADVEEGVAKKIVMAIAAGEVPNLSIRF